MALLVGGFGSAYGQGIAIVPIEDPQATSLSDTASEVQGQAKTGRSIEPDEAFMFFGAQGESQFFRTEEFDSTRTARLRNNFTEFPEFEGGLTIFGERAAMKIGGFIKADLISDLDPIDETDSFDTTSIPVGAADRQNARFHARQSRLSFDTRWKLRNEVVRAFVEADFFGDGADGSSALRLRHAYGTIGYLTAGQTWTTFTDPSAVPQTLDFEGAVSNVNRRQGLIRLRIPLWIEPLSWAIALEDPTVDIEVPVGVDGEGRTESPDLVTHLRYEEDWVEFQSAFVVRELGFQRTGGEVLTETAWGVNLAGSLLLGDRTQVYSQVTFGDGIGSYRGSTDIVATGPDSASIIGLFGWMISVKHSWNDRLTSNLTFSRLKLDDIAGQDPDNLLSTDYLAVNLICNPYERVFWGVEYLYGARENVSLAKSDANRIQMSLGFYLP
ncbi:MAG: DcaP family trimeric outer membrane transporter [Planctomycetota bacterium]